MPRRAPDVPAFRSPALLRLVVTGLIVVWSSLVVVVMLDEKSAGALATLALATLLLAAAVTPVLRRVAVPDGDHLLVNNGYRDRRLPWRDIEAFVLDATFWSGSVVAVLRSGEQVHLSATTVAFWARRRGWQELEDSRALLLAWSRQTGG